MSEYRDRAIANLERSQGRYIDQARHLVEAAQVFALLDLADAIRATQTPPPSGNSHIQEEA